MRKGFVLPPDFGALWATTATFDSGDVACVARERDARQAIAIVRAIIFVVMEWMLPTRARPACEASHTRFYSCRTRPLGRLPAVAVLDQEGFQWLRPRKVAEVALRIDPRGSE